MHKKRFIICPKCGKRGFPTSRWVRKEECGRHTFEVYYVYIGHYDKDLYQKQKQEYIQNTRKSKPTGRRWCKLPKEYGRCNYTKSGGIVLRKLENLENYLMDRYGEIPYI